MTQGRKISEDRLQKIKELVEEGELGFVQIAERFRISSGMVSALTKKYKWKNNRKSHYTYPLEP